MKTFISTILFALAIANAYANVLNVNNSAPSPGQYSTLASAITAAMPGDTLYLAGTGITYGGGSIDKQLTIIGPGFLIDGATLSGVAQTSILSLTNTAASGTRLIGLRIFQVNSTDAGASIFSNITVQRCLIDDCLFLGNDDWTGCTIEGNVFTSSGPNTTGNNSAANVLSSTIRNNIFNGILYYVTTDLIEQNIFCGLPNGNANIVASTNNNTFNNNIVMGRNCSSIDAMSMCTGNVTFSCSNPNLPGTGNQAAVDPLFVSFIGGYFTWISDFHLQVGSPAIGTGASGYDAGVYGGQGKYRKDAEPNIPVVRQVSVVGGNTAPANSTITINVNSAVHE